MMAVFYQKMGDISNLIKKIRDRGLQNKE